MTDLRKLAKGKPCLVRLPICNHDTETTVLAHYRLSGVSGIGMKSPDLLGAFACSDCHVECDTGNLLGLSRTERMLALAEGVFRTQAYLIEHDVIKW